MGALLRGAVRIRVAAGLRRKKGLSYLEARELAASVTDEMIEEMTPPEALGSIGDGTIIQAIIDFLNSPAGKALIDALIQLLIGLI